MAKIVESEILDPCSITRAAERDAVGRGVAGVEMRRGGMFLLTPIDRLRYY
jgi:hypothetical protein